MVRHLRQWFAGDVSGRAVALLTVASGAWGWLILAGLPYWARMEAAEGQAEIQARYHGPEALDQALRLLDSQARAEAWAFYALDVPNAVLFGLSLAALIRFGLRLWSSAHRPWTGLILLPLTCAATDLAENATLATGLALTPDAPFWLLSLSSGLTAVKLASGQAAIVVMLVLVVSGLARLAVQRIRLGRVGW